MLLGMLTGRNGHDGLMLCLFFVYPRNGFKRFQTVSDNHWCFWFVGGNSWERFRRFLPISPTIVRNGHDGFHLLSFLTLLLYWDTSCNYNFYFYYHSVFAVQLPIHKPITILRTNWLTHHTSHHMTFFHSYIACLVQNWPSEFSDIYIYIYYY